MKLKKNSINLNKIKFKGYNMINSLKIISYFFEFLFIK